MKFIVLFVLAFVALASAAPQLIYPGYVGGISTLGGLGLPRTVVAGPTVVNPSLGLTGGRLIAPGYFGGYPTFY